MSEHFRSTWNIWLLGDLKREIIFSYKDNNFTPGAAKLTIRVEPQNKDRGCDNISYSLIEFLITRMENEWNNGAKRSNILQSIVTCRLIAKERLGKKARNKYATDNIEGSVLGNERVFYGCVSKYRKKKQNQNGSSPRQSRKMG
jgi:hypothetical protein